MIPVADLVPWMQLKRSPVQSASTPSGTVLVSYVRGLALISQDRSGGTSFYHADGLGSIRFLTDSAGAVTDRYRGRSTRERKLLRDRNILVGELPDDPSVLFNLRPPDLRKMYARTLISVTAEWRVAWGSR